MKSQVKDTKKKAIPKVTVSIRNMDTNIWHRAGVHCKINQITFSEYIQKIIKADLAKKRKKISK